MSSKGCNQITIYRPKVKWQAEGRSKGQNVKIKAFLLGPNISEAVKSKGPHLDAISLGRLGGEVMA